MKTKKIFNKTLLTIGVCLISIIVMGCSFGTAKSIEIDAPSTVYVGKKIQLNCNKDVLWHSCDTSIATITSDGLLETFMEGKVKIIATLASDETKSNYVVIEVIREKEILNLDGKTKLFIGEKEKLSLTSSIHLGILDTTKFKWSSSDEKVLKVDEKGTVTAVSLGFAVIAVVSNETLASTSFKITVVNDYRYILIDGPTEVELENTIKLNATVIDSLTGDTVDETLIWESNNNAAATVDQNGLVTAVSIGKATITAYLESNPMVKKEFSFDVIQINRYLEISINNENLFVGDTTYVHSLLKPFNSTVQTYWQSSNPAIATVDNNGKVVAKAKGEVTISGYAAVSNTITGSITIFINEIDTEKPIISVDENLTTTNVTLSVGKTFDPMYGIKVLDNIDGDITDRVVVSGKINTLIRGTYTYTYDVIDTAGNKAITLTREITIVWDYEVTFIGHAGCYYGGMNSEEAFLKAATQQGYNAVECDLRVTKDGVFVLCHDETFADVNIANSTWSDLSKLEVTKTRGGISYTYKLCRLDTYLDICAKYDMVPVIEFKWTEGINSNDQSNMPKLMKLIEEKNLRNKVIFLTSMVNCLKWLRNNGYTDVKCQYLVNSCASDSTLATCTQYNFDISFNITKAENTAEWIQKYHEKGLKVSCYTLSQYTTSADLRKWIAAGVDYVTVDHLKVTDANNMH